MPSPFRTLISNPRPLRSLLATTRARRAYATISTKNPNPTPAKDDSKEQAMPIGRFYEAILNTPQGFPQVKPEEPATTVKKAQEATPEAKAKAESAATATSGTAPTASPAASAAETAKEVAAKASSLASSSADAPPPSVRQQDHVPQTRPTPLTCRS